ncbi:MAG: ribonuclease domain-containing protein [Bacillota bacterium]|nr:ribonuclease domain-containing protein [Bacillota bacterium]
MKKKGWNFLLMLLFCLSLCSGCGGGEAAVTEAPQTEAPQNELYTIEEDGWYYTTEDVALYLYTYGELPDNFITKKEAQSMGWDNKEGNLWEVADGMCIGGDYFGNREGLLPEEDEYTECDVNYSGGYRGGERIVFSDDGDIYYTGDHYESFEQLY